MSAKKLKLSISDKSQRKITCFTQNTDCSDSTVPSTDDTEVPDRREDDQPSKTESKPTEIRKFQPRLLAVNKWLVYNNNKNKMYCESCIDAKLCCALTSGTDNFKTSTLTRHVASADHQRAILAPTADEICSWKGIEQRRRGHHIGNESCILVYSGGHPINHI